MCIERPRGIEGSQFQWMIDIRDQVGLDFEDIH